jgi:hypothetical protein
VFEFSALFCEPCRSVRRLRFSPLSSRLPLGLKLECGHCHHAAFTLIRGRHAFCAACDTLSVVRIESHSEGGRAFACCSTCGQLLATLYGPPLAGRQKTAADGALRRKTPNP